jgi:hypothetical protein
MANVVASKMPGDEWQKFAQPQIIFAWMFEPGEIALYGRERPDANGTTTRVSTGTCDLRNTTAYGGWSSI